MEPPAGDDSLLGRVIAERIEIREKLGSGGMGDVYLAFHRGLKRPVAVKVMRELRDDLCARFEREAQAAAALDHPGCVRVFDLGREGDGLLYIVMEYVDGPSLASMIGSRMRVHDACRIACEVLDAIAFAHQHGIVHRDLKPQNVLIADGRAKVCDFGLARFWDADANDLKLTATGTFLGTPAYASPEQALGEDVGPKSDVYSAGVMLFEMLSGRLPFRAESPVEMLTAHLRDPPPRLGMMVAGLDPALDAVVNGALAKSAADRPTADELRRKLERFTTPALVPRKASSGTPLEFRAHASLPPVLWFGVIGALLAVGGLIAFRYMPDTGPCTQQPGDYERGLHIMSSPEGAQIWLDGEQLFDRSGAPAVTPYRLVSLAVKKEYTVELRLGGSSIVDTVYIPAPPFKGRWIKCEF